MRPLLLALLASTAFAADGNRLAYLDDDSPFWPTAKSPKFITPQWIGEPGVEAAVILSIDDLRGDPVKWETYVRPVLERLKQIDGRAPFSIFCNKFDPAHPQFQTWLKEGVSLEVHTIDHPCPCLGALDFAAASRTTHDCVDLLASIPGNKPVAFRMPCCDSMNSSSPRFFAEILSGTSAGGRWLSASSSVSMIFTDGENRARFAKYQPQELRPPTKVKFDRFSGDIADYPYPYLVGKKCVEFPFVVPSDWQGYNAIGSKNPQTTADWKAALDTTVAARGLMTLVVHPHGWSEPAQLVELIDYAVAKYGKRVKFLNIREALERIEKNAFGGEAVRGEGSVQMLDVNGDGFMDVMAGRHSETTTRLWQEKENAWHESKTPFYPDSMRFGMVRGKVVAISVPRPLGAIDGELFRGHSPASEWHEQSWRPVRELVAGLPMVFPEKRSAQDDGARLRDFDNDGICELVIANDAQSRIFRWSESGAKWEPADFQLPENIRIADAEGRDNGLRFVDLNGDGFLDIFQSNERGHAIYLWAGKVRPDLGWTRGWSHKVAVAATPSPQLTDSSILPFVKDGKNYGGWFHKGHVVWQNEDTHRLTAHVSRIAFADLIAVPMPPQKTPAESLAAMRPRPGFTVELVAAEPLIESPVAFEWDALGRLWVVEMRDYPLGMDGKGEPGGRIKILTDNDGDGRFDKATLFAEGLSYPTGLHPWRDGVIVAAVPDIAFYRATDGDDESDERTVLFTGFKPGNQQHRMNGFEWGLDGWLYGANGDSGGKVNGISISGRDFRFLPDGSAFEADSGQSQYGRRRDDWGHWFGNNNPTWLWHYFLDERYITRNPKLAVKTTKNVLANYPEPTRVFPAYALDAAPVRLNQPQSLGHVTSACSPAPYRDALFGPEFATSVFICEPVHNVVHREVLTQDGVTFLSRRAHDEQTSEFLASSDPWFRPVYAKTGPDGALYIADMHRFVLEHPEWIAPETQSRLDLRAGADKGRIWRIFPTSAKLAPTPNLAALDTQKLALAIESENGWQRDTAQRLLIENKAQDAAPLLRQMLRRSKNPKARLQALATLGTLNAATADDLRAGLRDKHSAVVRWALRLCETSAAKAELLDAMIETQTFPDMPVRRQLAFSLGAFDDPRARTHLEKLAALVADQPELKVAVQSSLAPGDPLFAKLNTPGAVITPPPLLPKPTTPDRAKVVAGYAGVAQLKGDAVRGRELFKTQCALCHRLKGDGIEVGPDLAMTADKPLDWMLVAMFDPSAAVEPRFALTLVKARDGTETSGVISGETGNNITLRLPGGSEKAILRSDIRSQTTTGPSLMPEGLEAALRPQDVADLLAWIRAK